VRLLGHDLCCAKLADSVDSVDSVDLVDLVDSVDDRSFLSSD